MKTVHALLLAVVVPLPSLRADPAIGDTWVRHTIDNTATGADGVRLDDVNGDGRLDVATGWEESGSIRAYLNPGSAAVDDPWPGVQVGTAASPEDAVFVDLDGDGAKDVVASTEGSDKKVYVFWAPSNPADYLDSSKWTKTTLYGSGKLWMYALPFNVDGRNGTDLIIGSRSSSARVGWLQSPATDRRNPDKWTFSPIANVDWTENILAQDVDHDGDLDLVVADTGELSWLENPGANSPDLSERWTRHDLGVEDGVRWTAIGDLDGDGDLDYIVPRQGESSSELLFLENIWSGVGKPEAGDFVQHLIPWPEEAGWGAKAASIGDIDLDGKNDIVLVSGENVAGDEGLLWLSYTKDPDGGFEWTTHHLSGTEGLKFDGAPLVDLDGDGDLDVITTEERTGLGVIWYENPTIAPVPEPSTWLLSCGCLGLAARAYLRRRIGR